MNVVIIGGTRFVGRHITDSLLARGHQVAHFNRGITDGSARSEVETIHGDRERDLSRLGDRRWDAVIDTCGYTPNVVEMATRYFSERTQRYLFISTISVYDHTRTDGPDEDAPLAALPKEVDRTVLDLQYYGALKALCESVVQSTFRARATILRPGLIAGPYDPTDRFTYWPVRVESGGEVLAPVSPDEPLQYIDARDLAAFAVHSIENQTGGSYNVVTPRGSLHFGDLTQSAASVAHSGASFTWADAGFLDENQVNPWSDLPLWIPAGAEHRSITNADSSRAAVRGLNIRPLMDTVRDTLTWANSANKKLGSLSAGLNPSENATLNAYHFQASARQ